MLYYLFIFVLLTVLLVSYPKKQRSLPRTMSKSFSPMFSSGILMVSGFIFVFNPFPFNFCEWYKRGIQFHSLDVDPSFPSAIYWRDYSLPIACSWCPCQSMISCLYMCGLVSGLCVLFRQSVCLLPIPVLILKSRIVMPPAFLKIALSLLGLFCFHMNFRIVPS